MLLQRVRVVAARAGRRAPRAVLGVAPRAAAAAEALADYPLERKPRMVQIVLCYSQNFQQKSSSMILLLYAAICYLHIAIKRSVGLSFCDPLLRFIAYTVGAILWWGG